MSADESPAGYVFLSYCREDSLRVNRLQRDLEDAGLVVWRDLDRILPGDKWRDELHTAITNRDILFVPCYSSTSTARPASVMHDEVRWAAEEHRRRRPERPWIFPVLLDDVAVPRVDLGAGGTLHDLHWAKLHDDWTTMVTVLADALRRRLAGRPPVPLISATHEVTDLMTGLYSRYLRAPVTGMGIDQLLAKGRALLPGYRRMADLALDPGLVLVPHPEPRRQKRGILKRLLTDPAPYAPAPAPQCWDVELVAGAWPPADDTGPRRGAEPVTWLADVVDAVTSTPADITAQAPVDLVRRCTPTIATLHAHRRWLRDTTPLLVRGGPGRPLPPSGWHQLRYYPEHEELRYEFGSSHQGDLGNYLPVTVPERFEVRAIRFTQLQPSLPELLPLLRPSLSAREVLDQPRSSNH